MKEVKKQTSGLYFLIFSSLIFLLFFRPGVAMRVSGDFDDRAYLCKAEQWVGIHDDFCPKSSHFSGIAITWFPAMLLARVFSFFDLGPFDNWAGFFVGMTSFICWIASLFLIEKIVALHTQEWEESPLKKFLNSWQYSILFLCNIPVLYFSTTRTFMVHAPELMWSLLFVYFCTRQNIFWALVSMLSLVLTRPNNLAAGLLFLVFLSRDPKSSLKNKNVFYASSMLLLCLGMVFFTYRFIFYGYNGTYFLPMLLDFKKQQLVAFLFREDFGIVWSQTLWLLSFLIWGLYFFKSSDIFATAGVWLLLSGSLSILWPTHGSTFGYRYLIGSYGGVLIIMLEALPKLLSSFSHRKIKGFMIAMTFFAVWDLLQCWIYPAPKPYWPWNKPTDVTLGVPYGQILDWIGISKELVKMNRFSQLGQILETLGLTASSDFLNRGTVNSYSLTGPVGWFNFLISLVVLGLVAFKLIVFSKDRKRKYIAKTRKKIKF